MKNEIVFNRTQLIALSGTFYSDPFLIPNQTSHLSYLDHFSLRNLGGAKGNEVLYFLSFHFNFLQMVTDIKIIGDGLNLADFGNQVHPPDVHVRSLNSEIEASS